MYYLYSWIRSCTIIIFLMFLAIPVNAEISKNFQYSGDNSLTVNKILSQRPSIGSSTDGIMKVWHCDKPLACQYFVEPAISGDFYLVFIQSLNDCVRGMDVICDGTVIGTLHEVGDSAACQVGQGILLSGCSYAGSDLSVDTVVMHLQAIQGEKGDSGSQGPKGDTGPKGDKGDTGLQGLKGDKGDTGQIGPKGNTGPQGPQGPVAWVQSILGGAVGGACVSAIVGITVYIICKCKHHHPHTLIEGSVPIGGIQQYTGYSDVVPEPSK